MNSEQAADNIRRNMAALQASMPTSQEVADALIQIAPVMDRVWTQCLDNDELWTMRAKSHGRLRTWLLRWQLRRRAHS